MDIILTERLELVAAPVQFIELLTADEYGRAGHLINASVPHGWPHDDAARAGLRTHLRAMQEDRRELPWRVRVIVLRESREVIGSVNLKGPPGRSGLAPGPLASRSKCSFCRSKSSREMLALMTPPFGLAFVFG